MNAKVVEPGEGKTVHVLGADINIRVSSRDTGGAFTTFDARILPLQGPPLHRQRDEDESWYIVEGDFRFEVDGEIVYAGAGSTVFARRGTAHTFQNIGTTPGRILTTAVPGGLDLFFEEIDAVAPRGSVPDPAKLLPIFEKYGNELLGPPLASRNVATASAAD
jgi:mannose-6-phosphate isomerase-like protein (cupin superfamily)